MQKLKSKIPPIIFFLIFLNLIFTRSFVGIRILNYRLGEYIVLIGFLSLFLFTIYFIKYQPSKEIRLISIILFYFVLQLLMTQANILNTYTFKAASFIGMISFFYFGLNFQHNNKYVEKLRAFLPVLLPIIYFFGSSIYPKFIGSFFINYSDKFEYIKASDILMVLVVVIFYYNNFENKKWNNLFIFIVLPAFMPILLYLSRGSFLALVVFFLMEMFSLRKELISNLLRTSLFTLLAIIVFIVSTFNIYGNLSFEKSNPLINEELKKSQTAVLQDNIEDLLVRRNYIGVLFSLYVDEGTLKSTDGTLNWRLDIWQDLLNDMNDENKNLFGYGYNEILPAMTDASEPGRMGADGMNENIHNYFLNVYARGGIPLLVMFLFLHYLFIKKWKTVNGDYRIVNFIIPLLIASFFDVSMEGVQFPLHYYFFIGTFLALKN
tara:strand:- start:350 stop:1654 length:1305 start_codon:yes stop_codon:yes gene_type:complete